MEYNAKTRLGIWSCFLLMLLVLTLLSISAIRNGKENDRTGSGNREDDAIYVGAIPGTWQTLPDETTTAPHGAGTQTTAQTTESQTGTTAKEDLDASPQKPLYYVTLSFGRIVLLDANGEQLRILNENADFLPRNDRELLGAGIALYSEEELIAITDDLS